MTDSYARRDRSGVTVIQFAQPARLMSMNDRGHWRHRHRLTRAWRHTTGIVAATLGAPSKRAHRPALVEVALPVADQRRRDPHNYYPTIKAIVDGLVDAGYWPDDTPDQVRTAEPRLVVDREFRTVTVHVTPLGHRPVSAGGES